MTERVPLLASATLSVQRDEHERQRQRRRMALVGSLLRVMDGERRPAAVLASASQERRASAVRAYAERMTQAARTALAAGDTRAAERFIARAEQAALILTPDTQATGQTTGRASRPNTTAAAAEQNNRVMVARTQSELRRRRDAVLQGHPRDGRRRRPLLSAGAWARSRSRSRPQPRSGS